MSSRLNVVLVVFALTVRVHGLNTRKLEQGLVTAPPDGQIKCGNCPCDHPCPQSPPPPVYPSPPPPPPVYPSPPPPPPVYLSPPPPPPKKPPTPSQNCPPPPPSYIYITGPPGDLYPVTSFSSAGMTFSGPSLMLVGFGLLLWMNIWPEIQRVTSGKEKMRMESPWQG